MVSLETLASLPLGAGTGAGAGAGARGGGASGRACRRRPHDDAPPPPLPHAFTAATREQHLSLAESLADPPVLQHAPHRPTAAAAQQKMPQTQRKKKQSSRTARRHSHGHRHSHAHKHRSSSREHRKHHGGSQERPTRRRTSSSSSSSSSAAAAVAGGGGVPRAHPDAVFSVPPPPRRPSAGPADHHHLHHVHVESPDFGSFAAVGAGSPLTHNGAAAASLFPFLSPRLPSPARSPGAHHHHSSLFVSPAVGASLHEEVISLIGWQGLSNIAQHAGILENGELAGFRGTPKREDIPTGGLDLPSPPSLLLSPSLFPLPGEAGGLPALPTGLIALFSSPPTQRRAPRSARMDADCSHYSPLFGVASVKAPHAAAAAAAAAAAPPPAPTPPAHAPTPSFAAAPVVPARAVATTAATTTTGTTAASSSPAGTNVAAAPALLAPAPARVAATAAAPAPVDVSTPAPAAAPGAPASATALHAVPSGPPDATDAASVSASSRRRKRKRTPRERLSSTSSLCLSAAPCVPPAAPPAPTTGAAAAAAAAPVPRRGRRGRGAAAAGAVAAAAAVAAADTPDEKEKEKEKDRNGLRQFSQRVKTAVESKKETTYNEVAEELVAAMRSESPTEQEQKNIRRRVYDALNVLLAMDIIVKDKKSIRWVGLPPRAREDVLQRERAKAAQETLLREKQAHLADLQAQHRAFSHLLQRQREQLEPPEKDSVIYLPFILINTDSRTHVECRALRDHTKFEFSFDQPFKLYDDGEILRRLGQQLLDTSGASATV